MFFESLNSLDKNIRDRDNYHISLTIDDDDFELNNRLVLDKISYIPNTSVSLGKSESKIHAINRDFPKWEFDIVVCWSNDMFATMYGFDDIMRERMDYIINLHGDKALFHFPEPDSKEFLNVLYVATKKYYDMFGYIYHPSYKSLWCDNETMEVAKMLGKYFYAPIFGLYEHRNPAYSQYNIQRDELFNYQQSLWSIDEANFNKRKKRNFDIHLLNEKTT